MKTISSLILGLAMLLSMAACQAGLAQPSAAPTAAPTPNNPPVDSTVAAVNSSPEMADLSAALGYPIREPAFLPDGYFLERTTPDEPTRSVCLRYRHITARDSVLFIAQGPATSAPALEKIPDWPDYAFLHEAVPIGGAQNSFQVSGWRRSTWACTEAAETETTPYSIALAPRFVWEVGDQQFELYSASGVCPAPGGVTVLDLQRVAESLTGVSTHAAGELDPQCLRSPAEAEKLAGFDVKEPANLLQDSAFYYATVEKTPDAAVTLYFFHKQHSDMGNFFSLSQYQEAPSYYVTSCKGLAKDACEIIDADGVTVVYQYFNPTEQLDWSDGSFFFSLFRSAGEPGKIYKDEMLKVVGSLK